MNAECMTVPHGDDGAHAGRYWIDYNGAKAAEITHEMVSHAAPHRLATVFRVDRMALCSMRPPVLARTRMATAFPHGMADGTPLLPLSARGGMMTRTYVILEISPAAFLEIALQLRLAGYDHAFDEDGAVIDMHGIALRSEEERKSP